MFSCVKFIYHGFCCFHEAATTAAAERINFNGFYFTARDMDISKRVREVEEGKTIHKMRILKSVLLIVIVVMH